MCNSYGYWYPVAINWFYARSTERDWEVYDQIVANHKYGNTIEYIMKNKSIFRLLVCFAALAWCFGYISFLLLNVFFEKNMMF